MADLCLYCGRKTTFLTAQSVDGGVVHADCHASYYQTKKHKSDTPSVSGVETATGIFATAAYLVFGHDVDKDFGLVRGSTVRSRHFGSDVGASLKSVVGGELRGATELMETARDVSLHRMFGQAQKLGANAVVGIRFSTSNIWEGAAEVLAYGTAQLLKPIDDSSDES